MGSLILVFPQIDPTILSIGGLHLRWYGLMYVLAFLCGSAIMGHLVKKYGRIKISTEDIGEFLFFAIIGTILGGRIGYILFYNLPYFVAHPAKIFAVWEGGMSFHGGLIGVAVAGYLFVRKHKVPYLQIADLAAVPAALGLAFGRVGNFINGELVGRPTTEPWGMLFPGQLIPRHPVQLYAVGKDLLLFWLLWEAYKRQKKDGTTIALLLLGYGLLRFTVEWFREPDPQVGYIGIFTEGQLLSLPLILIGTALLWSRWHSMPMTGTKDLHGNSKHVITSTKSDS